MSKHYLAFDLGAGSGRVMLGSFGSHGLRLEEVYRFSNGPVRVIDSLHWDVLRLFDEMKTGLATVGARTDVELAGVGVDTWGVDFGLLGKGDVLLGNPYHYLDRRTAGTLDRLFERIGRDEIFARTGIQFLEINTINQLLAMAEANHPWLASAETFLPMPNLLMFLLSGVKLAEYTHASTTQLLDARTRQWADPLFERLGLPRDIMPEVVEPGTITGELLPWIGDETGAGRVPVIAVGSHDTASAFASVPADPATSWCTISSGTWSLVGVETTTPRLTEKVARYNFTNEGGVAGTIRLLKNVMGLMLIQGCRRAWSRPGSDVTYDQLNDLAAQTPAFNVIINPDAPCFWNLGDTPEIVRDFCRRTGQAPPDDRGQIIRAILEGLALRYRQVLGQLEEILETKLDVIHIVGGGSRNALLCQFTADAAARPVIAGPAEATATGNILVQALATGELATLTEARGLLRDATPLALYEPRKTAIYDAAFERFVTVSA